MTNVPMKGDLVVWAREHRGLSQAELAEKLGVPLIDVQAVEAETKEPNLTFFRRLSSRLRIPSGTLLRQTRPQIPPMPTDYRTVEGRPPEVGFETRIAVSFARTIAENVKELVENEIASPLPVLPSYDHHRDDPEEAGEAERTRLGVSIVAQLGWRGDQAFRNWRTVIEAAGAFVLIKNFPLADCKGFTIFEDRNAPLIIISKHEKRDVARTFTLVHEYAHLLIREPGFSDHDDRNPVEAWCNKFAGAFLMPRSVLRELVGTWPNEPVNWSMTDVRNWARRLKVSQQALAIRFEAVGLAPSGFFNHIRTQQGQSAPPRLGDSGNYVNTQINELGDRFAAMVLNAQGGDLIQTAEAAEILAIRPVHFDRIRQQIRTQNTRAGVA